MSLLNDYIDLTKNRLKKEIKLSDNEINELLNKYPIKSGINKIQKDYYGYINRNGQYLYLFRAIHKQDEEYRTSGKDKSVWISVNRQHKFGEIESKWIAKYEPPQDFLSTHTISDWWLDTTIKQKPKESYGEFNIRRLLTIEPILKNFEIIQEYEINELTGFEPFWIKTPRFDFALKDKETKKIIVFIEFNGKQHFEESNEEENIRRQQRDMVKRGWAASYGIPVIDLSYAILNSQNLANCLVAFLKGWLKGWDVRCGGFIK